MNPLPWYKRILNNIGDFFNKIKSTLKRFDSNPWAIREKKAVEGFYTFNSNKEAPTDPAKVLNNPGAPGSKSLDMDMLLSTLGIARLANFSEEGALVDEFLPNAPHFAMENTKHVAEMVSNAISYKETGENIVRAIENLIHDNSNRKKNKGHDNLLPAIGSGNNWYLWDTASHHGGEWKPIPKGVIPQDSIHYQPGGL